MGVSGRCCIYIGPKAHYFCLTKLLSTINTLLPDIQKAGKAQKQSMAAEPLTTPIAIIGMGCRFAGDATDPEKLWKLLEQGQSACSEIPHTRFNVKGVYHPNGERIGSVRVMFRFLPTNKAGLLHICLIRECLDPCHGRPLSAARCRPLRHLLLQYVQRCCQRHGPAVQVNAPSRL